MRWISLLIALTGIVKGFAQNSATVYGGTTLSYMQVHYEDIQNGMDSMSNIGGLILLPAVGFDIDFSLNKRFLISTGAGIKVVGSKNYAKGFASAPFVNLSRNLKITWLSVPISVVYQLNSVCIVGGYAFNYTVRKNQNFLSPSIDSFEFVSGYSNAYHTLFIGLRRSWDSLRFSVSGQYGLNPLSDINSNLWRERQKIWFVEATVGYQINE